MAILGCNLKNNRMNSVHFQGKSFSVTVMQLYTPTANAEEAEVERFCDDLQAFQNQHQKKKKKKDILFIRGDWNAKVVSREIPGITDKFGHDVQIEARQRLTKFCQEKALVIANTCIQQDKRQLHTWTSTPHMVNSEIRLIIFFVAKDEETLYSQQKQDWELTGSDHEHFNAKFRLKLKEVGKKLDCSGMT